MSERLIYIYIGILGTGTGTGDNIDRSGRSIVFPLAASLRRFSLDKNREQRIVYIVCIRAIEVKQHKTEQKNKASQVEQEASDRVIGLVYCERLRLIITHT